MAFAALGKGAMDRLSQKVAEIYGPDVLVVLEDAA